MIFIDDFTQHTWACLIEKKSEVFSYFLKVKILAERETSQKIRYLRTEGGKEYFSDQFSSYLQKEGIRREFLCRYTLQQNNMAKRKNQMIKEVLQIMLGHSRVSITRWKKQTSRLIHTCTRNKMTHGINVENLKEAKPWEFSNSEQNHYMK